MVELASTIWADGPTVAPHEPDKQQIRVWGTWVEGIITAFTSNGGLIYSSLALLNADLLKSANSMAWVIGDPVAANNGVYGKVGASGLGSWTRRSDLPFSFIIASNAGAGTPNGIQATTSIPVSGSALIWMNVTATNTSSPVSVSFNGGSALTIKTNSGNDVAAGGLVAGMIVLGIISGPTFRLVSDQASSAIVAAAEGWANVAQAAANANLVFVTRAAAAAASIPTSIHSFSIKGSASEGDGLGSSYIDTNNGSNDTIVSADARTWFRAPDVNVTRMNAPLRSRLPRPADLYRMDGQTYMRFMCKGTGDNPMGRAVGMAIDEVGRNLFMVFVTNGRIHRFDLDGPVAARSLDYMDCGSILGHQTLGLEHVAGGGIRLWSPAATPGRVLRMTYVAGGAPTTEEYILHENEGGTNYSSLTVSHDGRYLICTGSEGDNRPVKTFELSKLIAGGPGDYRSAWLYKFELPAYLRETDQSLQDIASEGSVVFMISGRGALLSYDNKRGICDIQTGELLQVIDSKVGVTDGAGVDGNNVNEPEGADMMAGDDGNPVLVTFNLAGGADARNSFRVYVSGRRPSPAAVASSVTTRLVSAMPNKPTSLRQFLIESVVRELAAADVWNRLSWLHLANFDAASSRLNWMDPRWGALVDDGVSGSMGFLADRGFNVATAGKSLIFDAGPRSAPNMEYISAHYGGILLGNDLGATIMALASGTQVLLQPRSSGGNWASRHNCSNTSSETNADSNGHYIINRLIPSEYTKWKNGSLFATEAEPATTFSTNTMRYMSGSPSGIRLVAAHAGMGLDNTRRQALEAALLRYRTEIGAV